MKYKRIIINELALYVLTLCCQVFIILLDCVVILFQSWCEVHDSLVGEAKG